MGVVPASCDRPVLHRSGHGQDAAAVDDLRPCPGRPVDHHQPRRLPQVVLGDLLKEVTDENNTAASIVIGALIIFVGIVFYALVLWAKA